MLATQFQQDEVGDSGGLSPLTPRLLGLGNLLAFVGAFSKPGDFVRLLKWSLVSKEIHSKSLF